MRSRSAPRRDTPRPTRTVVHGLLVTVVLAVAGWFALQLYDGVPTTDYETVVVSTPTVGNLLPHDAVRIGGKRVGQVLDVDLGGDGRPRIELQLDPGTKVPVDTEVRIRANGLLGARYVELVPGTSPTLLAEGRALEGDETSYAFGLPEAVTTFDRETRGGLQGTIQELGAGVHANGAGLNASLRALAVAAGQFDELAASVIAEEDAVDRLLPSLAAGVTAMDRSRAAVRTFPDAVSDASEPFIEERDAVRETIEKAPGALRATASGLREGRAFVSSLRALSTAAARTLPPAPDGFRALSTLLDEGVGPLTRATPTVATVGAAADGARRTVVGAKPLLPHLDETLTLAEPFLEYVAKYSCDLVNAAAVLRSMTGFGQAGEGPLGPAMAFRLEAVVPAGLEAVGLKDELGFLERDGYAPPCKYVSRPYPQLVDLPLGGR